VRNKHEARAGTDAQRWSTGRQQTLGREPAKMIVKPAKPFRRWTSSRQDLRGPGRRDGTETALRPVALCDDSLEGVGLLSSWLDRLFLLGPDQEFLRRLRPMGSPPPPVLLLEAVA
jgi:hypothetical protein